MREEGGEHELSEREEVIIGFVIGAVGAGGLGLISSSDSEECEPESI